MFVLHFDQMNFFKENCAVPKKNSRPFPQKLRKISLVPQDRKLPKVSPLRLGRWFCITENLKTQSLWENNFTKNISSVCPTVPKNHTRALYAHKRFVPAAAQSSVGNGCKCSEESC